MSDGTGVRQESLGYPRAFVSSDMAKIGHYFVFSRVHNSVARVCDCQKLESWAGRGLDCAASTFDDASTRRDEECYEIIGS
jgi:hypothetical protein